MVKVSVIMSVYNENIEWIKESIESILNQSYKYLEFIIVLDNPNNNKIKELLIEYSNSDERIILIINEKNIGLIKSLNKGIEVSNGKYIARMDADDVSMINRFEKQVEFLEKHKNIHLISTQVRYIDESGNLIYIPPNYGMNINTARKCLNYRDVFIHPSWMFRKNILVKLKKYNDIPTAEDYDFLCRLSLNGYNFKKIDNVLVNYRIRKNSITNSKILYQKKVSNIIRNFYRKAQKDSNFYNEKNIIREIQMIKIDEESLDKYWKSNNAYNLGIKNIKEKNILKGSFNIFKSIILNKEKVRDLKDTIYLKIINKE